MVKGLIRLCSAPCAKTQAAWACRNGLAALLPTCKVKCGRAGVFCQTDLFWLLPGFLLSRVVRAVLAWSLGAHTWSFVSWGAKLGKVHRSASPWNLFQRRCFLVSWWSSTFVPNSIFYIFRIPCYYRQRCPHLLFEYMEQLKLSYNTLTKLIQKTSRETTLNVSTLRLVYFQGCLFLWWFWF